MGDSWGSGPPCGISLALVSGGLGGCRRKGIMQTDKCKELYAEIEKITPSLEYCLAPKKAPEKTGASSLRAGVAGSSTDGMGTVRRMARAGGWQGGVDFRREGWRGLVCGGAGGGGRCEEH